METKRVIFENDDYIVMTTGHDYDFIATVVEKATNGWWGLLANEKGYCELGMWAAGIIPVHDECWMHDN